MAKIKRYDDEFKKSLVDLHLAGKTQSDLCRDYGVSTSALAKWIKQYSQVRLEDNTVLTAKQIQELQKRNAQRRGKSYLKKSECHIHAKLQVRLKAVYRLRFEHTTVMLCRVLHVNRSTYYNFINKKPSKREIENQRLRKHLLEIYMKAKKRIGTRAFKIILLRDYGINISEGRILRLLKAMTLPKMSTIKPRFKSNHSPIFPSDNLLKQEFNPKSPNQVWTTDFTYISIGPKRHVYLCAILDLYSRKCIAWKVSDKIDAKLACDTLQIAINTRKPTEPILFHSDQGSQFKSQEFRKLLDEHHLMPSYSKPGYPYDNAVTEVFFKYLKQREINRKTFHSIEEVRLSCFEYIERFYNNYNPHSANNGLTPNQKELEYFKN
uniref:Transposase AB of ISLL6 n=9 Tax=Lactococcus lactis TaxID=1358 RepID=A4VC77_9LACT|nr:transposase AB of ISLL6 [Lactococcus lactis]